MIKKLLSNLSVQEDEPEVARRSPQEVRPIWTQHLRFLMPRTVEGGVMYSIGSYYIITHIRTYDFVHNYIWHRRGDLAHTVKISSTRNRNVTLDLKCMAN